MLSNSSNTFNPANRKEWHVKCQEMDGPSILPVWCDGKDMWQCYCSDDEISAVGSTPSKAYKAWLKKTIQVEEYMDGKV